MSRKLRLQELDLKDKRVLIRVDFNVPVDKHGNILDDTRIRKSLPTIEYVLQSGGKPILMSHFGRPKGKTAEYSLKKIAVRLGELLHKKVIMAPDTIGKSVEKQVAALKPGDVLLLENVRFYPAEEKPELDPTFAKKIAEFGDCYINDAFGSSHRPHSSITIVPSYFPKKAAQGFLLEKELSFLGEHLLRAPQHPFYAIIAGAKISTKLGVLKALLQKVDCLFIGGAMAYTFFKSQNIPIGDSLVEDDMIQASLEILEVAKKKKVPLLLPIDIVAAKAFDNKASHKIFDAETGIPEGYQGMDIGPRTISAWTEMVENAKTIFWNGPVGVFEMSNFATGTRELATAIASFQNIITIAGGGETIAAIEEAGLTNKFSHISTGGGASLEFLEQGTLPGIEALSSV